MSSIRVISRWYEAYWFFGGPLLWAAQRRLAEWSQARRRVARRAGLLEHGRRVRRYGMEAAK